MLVTCKRIKTVVILVNAKGFGSDFENVILHKAVLEIPLKNHQTPGGWQVLKVVSRLA